MRCRCSSSPGGTTCLSRRALTGRSSASSWSRRTRTATAGSTARICRRPGENRSAEHAVDFLASRLLAAKRPVTLVAARPAHERRAPARAPSRRGREGSDRIVLMGGAIGPGNMTAAAEFNIWIDPEAAHRVFESGLDVTMVGLDVTNKAVLTREHADRLRASGQVAVAAAQMLDFYLGSTAKPTITAARRSTMPSRSRHLVRPELVQTLAPPRRRRDCGRALQGSNGRRHATAAQPAGAERARGRRRRRARVRRAPARAPGLATEPGQLRSGPGV